MEGGNSKGSEECGIGSIVWVRRRNGSWWPGKILGSDELSATHLMSPRSGTPVKLLGRQDASVDWYNLEKSKRVKAFRCGEFDDCIERAESSLGMPPKKREKYARREDAILHALELEREMLENQGDKLNIPQHVKSSSSLPSLKARSVTPAGNLKFSGKHGNCSREELPTGVDSYPKDLNGNNIHLRQQKEGKELYPDDNISGIPIPMITGTSGSEQCIANDYAIAGYRNGVTSFVESSDRGSMSSELLIGDTSVTRPHRRHLKVMQNNAKSLVQHAMQAERPSGSVSMSGSDHVGNIYRTKRSRCIYQPVVSNDFIYDSASSTQTEMFPLQSGESYSGSMSEESPSGSTEDTESDSSETEDLETDSDEEMRIFSGRRIRPAALGMSEAQHRNLSNHVSDELALMEEPPAFHARYHDNANTAVSKWKMKGKRNTRHLTKSSVDVADARSFGGTVDETYLRLRGGNLGKRTSEQRLGFHHRSYDAYNGFDESDFIEKDGQTYMDGFDNRGHLTAKRACRSWNSHVGRDTTDWDEMICEDQPSLRWYSDPIEYFFPTSFSHGNFRGRPRTLLIEVDLKVQASYPKERVPIVSLMSKLDGKAIIGHPIQIEALEDGSSEMILSRTADFGNETHYSEGDATLPPVWRTARRTANYRVPRPDLSSALDDDESEDYLPLESKQTPNRLHTGRSSYGGSPTRKVIFHVPRPLGEKKPVGRPPKRVSLSSGQKTRTLSSFLNERKCGAKSKRNGDSYLLQGLIKSEAGPTTVACIPVKLVYSRLYEAVGRPPAAVASNHEALVNMNTETG